MVQRRPVSFIATAQPDRAKVFYQDVLGLKLADISPFALVFEECGHSLRVQIVDAFSPPPYTVHGWQVENIATEVETLRDMGIAFLQFDALEQDDLGIWTTPNGDKIAWFKDPCGNTLSFTEMS